MTEEAKRTIETQHGLEVYVNPAGNIVINQPDLRDEDNFVVIHPDFVEQLIDYLHQVAAEVGAEFHQQ